MMSTDNLADGAELRDQQIHNTQMISENTEDENPSRYNLRSRENIDAPLRFQEDKRYSKNDRIERLKRQRSGKKSLITTKIKQIYGIIEGHGSRTKLKFLHEKLIEAQKDMLDLHEQLMEEIDTVDDLFSDDWLVEVNAAVDDCSSEVNEYLVSRMDDPPSEAISKTSWVEQYLEKSDDKEDPGELSILANQLNQLAITTDIHHPKRASFKQPPELKHPGLQHYMYAEEQRQKDVFQIDKNVYKDDLPATATPFQTARNKVKSERQSFLNPDIHQQRKVSSAPLLDEYHPIYEDVEVSVDAWIDSLDVYEKERAMEAKSMDKLSISWLMQQNLPRIQIPIFDGSPTKWLEFVVKFKDLVHDLQFISNTQKMTYLLQHLEGESKRAVQCFSNDKIGYILALKRLKYMFGQKPRICQAYIQKMTRGKQIGNDDNKRLIRDVT